MAVSKFAESAVGLARNPLGIIALFIVLVYGFASVVVSFAGGLGSHIVPLIYFLIFFPVLVFFGFLWLVTKHHSKMYGPSDFKDESNFIKSQLASAASLGAAVSKSSAVSTEVSERQIGEIVDAVSKARKDSTTQFRKRRVLWVDDRPENNVFERKALEAQGVEFSLALSTDEAIELLDSNGYSAVISDMGRREGPEEGYKLLKRMKDSGNSTPFIIYAGSNAPEHKKLAKERGAVGSTSRADELFDLVMSVL